MCGDTLTGILSYSVNCGTKNKPSVYTDVAQHSAWIKQIISGGGGGGDGGGAAARDSMSYVTISAMLAALSSLWSCRT